MPRRKSDRKPNKCRDCGDEIIGHMRQVHCYQGGCGKGKPDWWAFATRDERADYIRRGSVPSVFVVKKCELCDKSYQPQKHSNKRSKYCSDECRTVALRDDVARYKKSDKGAETRRAYSRKLLATDPVHRIKQNVRERIRVAMLRVNREKPAKSLDILGMSGPDFMDYLLNHENNACGKFTRENYGTFWHIDHIKPLAAFNLLDDDELMAAFHYSNCQPLEADENLKKSSFYEGEYHRHSFEEGALK